MEARLPRHHWLALSFGGSHINTDMVVFHANGIDRHGNDIEPDAYGCKSINFDELNCEIIDGSSDWDSEGYSLDDDDYVEVRVARNFNTGDGNDFFVPTD